MKFIKSFIIMLALAVLPAAAHAQLTVPQGGTGQTSFTANQILYGNSTLRLGSEAAFTYNASTNLFTFPNATGTALTLTTLCLDTCETAWPTANFDSTAVDATTWSDGVNASNVWTFDVSGTDTTLTFGSDLFTFNGGVTLTTGNTLILGTTQWNSGDSIDGEVIANDTIDDDSIDFIDVTLADLTFDVGSVSTTEYGYLDGVTSAIQTQLNAKQATLTADDITPDMLLSTGQTDEYCLSYEATGDTWEWKDCSGGSGDNVTINGIAIVDPNFVSTGDIAFSTSTTDVIANINAGSIIEPDLDADVAAADGDFLQYDSTGTNFTWRDASEVRTDLGLVIGTNVQAYDADLTTIAGLTEADSTFIVGTGAGWTTETGATVRTSLGLGSLATLSTISNTNWSGTDLSVENGGTGVSTLTDGGVLIGNGTGALVATAVLTNGQLLIGDGTTDPTVATLTAGTGIGVANGAGSITISADLGTSIDTTEITDDTITHADIADADQASTMCIYIEDPVAADDLTSIWANKTANDFLLTEIWAESDQTVAFDLQVDDGTPADVNGTDITPAAGEAEDTTLSGDTTVAAGEELDLAVTSVTNTPTWVSICWTGNWVD